MPSLAKLSGQCRGSAAPTASFAHGARFRARVRAIRRSSANLEPEDLHQAATSLPAWLELKVRAELVRFGLLKSQR